MSMFAGYISLGRMKETYMLVW